MSIINNINRKYFLEQHNKKGLAKSSKTGVYNHIVQRNYGLTFGWGEDPDVEPQQRAHFLRLFEDNGLSVLRGIFDRCIVERLFPC